MCRYTKVLHLTYYSLQRYISKNKIFFYRLKYNAEKLSLQVTIVRCSDLPPKDSNNGSSDPYVKLQLLPEKQHKVKTRVLRKTLDPVYDEDFTFYGINPNQLQATTLHFVVLSFDRYSRDDVIGEVIHPLSGVDFEGLAKQIEMAKEITPRNLKVRQIFNFIKRKFR